MANQKRKQELEKEALLREQRRQARRAKRGQHARMAEVPEIEMGEVTVRFMTTATTPEERDEAWFALRFSETLSTYVAAARYDDWKRKAIVNGSFVLQLPFEIARRIESELAPQWRKGRMLDGESISAT